ncbi:MAG TPA: transketolase [Candidatus Kapabacteria bacterium]|nr:transketolase [Candidatus Kapabacteria bacterium]
MASKKKQYTLKQLEQMATTIREDIIKMLVEAGSGHSAGPLGLADIFTALYFRVLNHNPKKPLWEGRDRLCLSCGHVVPVRYAAMARAGYFPVTELKTLRKLNSRLQGHPGYVDMPALEHSSGPLGQGSSVAVGKAIAAKLNKQKHHVFCIVSDGEQDEGQTWEAAMLAGKMKLNNLIFIMDRNNIQIDGYTEDVMPLENLREKYEAFNWHVIEIDGNNMHEIIDACEYAKTIHEKPTMIIAHTMPGKGVDFMEGDYKWHGSPPNKEQAKEALSELRTLRGRIRSEHE